MMDGPDDNESVSLSLSIASQVQLGKIQGEGDNKWLH